MRCHLRRAAEHGIVMGSDDYNLPGVFCSGDFDFDIAAGFTLYEIILSVDSVAGFGERGF